MWVSLNGNNGETKFICTISVSYFIILIIITRAFIIITGLRPVMIPLDYRGAFAD